MTICCHARPKISWIMTWLLWLAQAIGLVGWSKLETNCFKQSSFSSSRPVGAALMLGLGVATVAVTAYAYTSVLTGRSQWCQEPAEVATHYENSQVSSVPWHCNTTAWNDLYWTCAKLCIIHACTGMLCRWTRLVNGQLDCNRYTLLMMLTHAA